MAVFGLSRRPRVRASGKTAACAACLVRCLFWPLSPADRVPAWWSGQLRAAAPFGRVSRAGRASPRVSPFRRLVRPLRGGVRVLCSCQGAGRLPCRGAGLSAACGGVAVIPSFRGGACASPSVVSSRRLCAAARRVVAALPPGSGRPGRVRLSSVGEPMISLFWGVCEADRSTNDFVTFLCVSDKSQNLKMAVLLLFCALRRAHIVEARFRRVRVARCVPAFPVRRCSFLSEWQELDAAGGFLRPPAAGAAAGGFLRLRRLAALLAAGAPRRRSAGLSLPSGVSFSCLLWLSDNVCPAKPRAFCAKGRGGANRGADVQGTAPPSRAKRRGF